MASQALGSMQDAPQDVGSIPKFGISEKLIGPTVREAQGGQDKGALYRPLGSKRRRKHVFSHWEISKDVAGRTWWRIDSIPRALGDWHQMLTNALAPSWILLLLEHRLA